MEEEGREKISWWPPLFKPFLLVSLLQRGRYPLSSQTLSWPPSLSSSASFYCRLWEMLKVLDFIYIICFLVVCDLWHGQEWKLILKEHPGVYLASWFCCCNVNSFCYSTGKSLRSQEFSQAIIWLVLFYSCFCFCFWRSYGSGSWPRLAMFDWLMVMDKVLDIQSPENNLKRLNGCPR